MNDIYEAVLDVLSKKQATELKLWLEEVLNNKQELSAEGRVLVGIAYDRIKLEQWNGSPK